MDVETVLPWTVVIHRSLSQMQIIFLGEKNWSDPALNFRPLLGPWKRQNRATTIVGRCSKTDLGTLLPLAQSVSAICLTLIYI